MTDMKENALAPQWATTSGDMWSRRWMDTDRGLAGLSPRLLSAITDNVLAGPFRAFEVGCGAGSTSIALAQSRPDAEITACDISPTLVEVARQRTERIPQIHVIEGDAELVAEDEGPFDLIFSRHGVMFFPDPVRAFRSLRRGANRGASLVFSCFQSWHSNSWASDVACAAADRELPAPGREPSGFAFADPDYVRQTLSASGWDEAEVQIVLFDYLAGEGDDAVETALSFLTDIGPAARIVQSLPEVERAAALERMRGIIEHHFDGRAVVFSAAAWIWRAKAGSAAS
jgi:SAM-dependent methyltransferase